MIPPHPKSAVSAKYNLRISRIRPFLFIFQDNGAGSLAEPGRRARNERRRCGVSQHPLVGIPCLPRCRCRCRPQRQTQRRYSVRRSHLLKFYYILFSHKATKPQRYLLNLLLMHADSAIHDYLPNFIFCHFFVPSCLRARYFLILTG